MTTGFTNAALFLIDTLFNLYIMVLMLRMLLQYLGANYYNPVSQFVVRTTTPVVRPFQQFIPGFRGVDLAIVTVIFLLTLIKLASLSWIKILVLPKLPGLLILSIADILKSLASLYTFLIIGRVILSWIQNPQLGPISEILYRLTEGLLQPIRQRMPLIGGFDLSPLVLLIIIQVLVIIIVGPIHLAGIKAGW